MKLNGLIFLLLLSFSLCGQTSVQTLIDKADGLYDSSPSESYNYYLEAEKKAKLENQHELDGQIKIGKIRYLLLVTDYEKATHEINEALTIYKASNDKNGLSTVYALQAILFDRIGESDKALKMSKNVLALNKEIKDTAGIINSLTNLSLSYYERNDLDSMKYFLDELGLYKDNLEEKEYYYYYQNLGTYYVEKTQFDLAFENYNEALFISEKLSMTDSKATLLMLYSRAYRKNNSLKNAEEFAYKSYNFSKENNLLYETNEALEELILIKEAQGDYKSAFTLQKEWLDIKAEIFNIEKIQKIKSIEGQLKIAEKEKKIKETEFNLQQEKLQNAKSQTQFLWLTGIAIIIFLVLAFTLFIYNKTRKLNITINRQKQEVLDKSNRLEYALKNIQDSIEYSKRIQNAILPPLKLVKESLKDSFILYKPKDIVAGDFYWMENKDGKILFAAADCTGHGVPGAMVSVVCNNALNRSVREHGLTIPGEILDKSREIVIQEFEKSDEEVKDGMDIALCVIEGNTLQFAGAHNPLWLIRDGELIEFKGDKQPIGKFYNEKPFTTHTIDLIKNDTIYIFSDGFADQFGGENGKKYKVKSFKKLLVEICNKSMTEQKQIINNEFEKWKGDLEQLDDVCVIGVRL